MGTVELLLVLIIAAVYMAIPVITLIYVFQLNKRVAAIEGQLDKLLASK